MSNKIKCKLHIKYSCLRIDTSKHNNDYISILNTFTPKFYLYSFIPGGNYFIVKKNFNMFTCKRPFYIQMSKNNRIYFNQHKKRKRNLCIIL